MDGARFMQYIRSNPSYFESKLIPGDAGLSGSGTGGSARMNYAGGSSGGYQVSGGAGGYTTNTTYNAVNSGGYANSSGSYGNGTSYYKGGEYPAGSIRTSQQGQLSRSGTGAGTNYMTTMMQGINSNVKDGKE